MLLAAGAGTTATAKGWEVGGSGSTYFLSDSFSVESNIDFVYGRAADQVYVGDWDGDGTDTLAARRGNEYHVKNTLDGVTPTPPCTTAAPTTPSWSGTGTATDGDNDGIACKSHFG
ncbi:hypothetical protein PU560_07255 [Georgenia sp. 10Sc9-8]|uniref:Calcium-binding protein n=1 Tax=Georgenia halotolerans TaxID=3028317 RepID=A0ABT5TW29_9MICO|nr:hypothetical protein [Georgenia halotolerans]